MQRDSAYLQVETLRTKITQLEFDMSVLNNDKLTEAARVETRYAQLKRSLEREQEEKDDWIQKYRVIQKEQVKMSQSAKDIQNSFDVEKQAKTSLEMKFVHSREAYQLEEVKSKELRAQLDEISLSLKILQREHKTLEDAHYKLIEDRAEEVKHEFYYVFN